MNAQDPKAHEALRRRQQNLDLVVEDALYRALKTKWGRTLIAFMVRGTHGLEHTYRPGMSFDVVAFEAGRQYDARELIRIVRKTERCSNLFNRALREYENEWTSDTG